MAAELQGIVAEKSQLQQDVGALREALNSWQQWWNGRIGSHPLLICPEADLEQSGQCAALEGQVGTLQGRVSELTGELFLKVPFATPLRPSHPRRPSPGFAGSAQRGS
jgi:hypothetical protein